MLLTLIFIIFIYLPQISSLNFRIIYPTTYFLFDGHTIPLVAKDNKLVVIFHFSFFSLCPVVSWGQLELTRKS